MAAKAKVEVVVFALNGERYEVSDADPGMTLLEFLRTRTRFKGAKLGCGEGGCGACVVLLSTYDPITDQVKDFSVSSCLTLVGSINHCSVMTTEGLGNSKDGFHAIHERFSGFHASQCGFCTPGMCMSLFSALVNADKSSKPEAPDGFSKLTKYECEKAVSGNLCRCTGYRPIADACKSFAADVDLEDLGLNSYWKKGAKDANITRLPSYTKGAICTFPEFLKLEIKSYLANLDIVEHTSLVERSWYRPESIEELYQLIDSEAFCESRMKMVVGSTASGIYKDLDVYDKYIDLRGIPELTLVKKDSKGIEVGAAVSISRTIELLRGDDDYKNLVFNKIADHMEKVATPFVRNTASLGGNIIMAQRNQFPSDISTVLLAAGSTVSIQISSERLNLTLEEFLERPPCNYKVLLVSIYIPCCSLSSISLSAGTEILVSTARTSLLFETYRAAPRPLGNALAYINSSFLAQASLDEMSGDLVLDNLRLAFGAYGGQHAIRATKVENLLVGRRMTPSVLLEACRALRETIVAKEGTKHAAYRSSLAVAFLFSFLHPLTKGLFQPVKALQMNECTAAVGSPFSNVILNGHAKTSLDKATHQVETNLSCDNHVLLSSEQVVEFNKDYHPVGKPTKKVGAELQASGEAVYVDDIPSPKGCLYGAFICSTKPLGNVMSIKLDSSLEQKYFVQVVTVKDIPKGGENVGASTIFGPEALFADSLTEFAGQPLGIVIAESQRIANMAAKHAVVNYSIENLEPPVLSIDEAVKRCSYFDVPPFLYPKKVGDFSKEMSKADHTILSAEVNLESQYYFYMETQTALAVPDEDNCMVVYSSSQCPETAQSVIAKCLGLPFNNVRVITRRVGGGFGGKAVRSLPVAAACALAAFKLRHPVRMYLDRKTDMVMTGGRHPMKIYYSVGYKTDGKITALHIDLFINAGITKDVSPVIPHNFIGALKKYNWGAFSFDVKVCKTNIATRSAMRGPGEVQGSYVAEAIIEHVASVLSADPTVIREKNLHTIESLMLFYEGCVEEPSEYTLPSIFTKLTSSASFQQRVEMVRCFNSSSKWKKRGISCVPIVHKVSTLATPGKVSILNDGSIVVEVGGIELGQGLWTKVRQMAAFALGQIWADGSQDLLEKVRVIQADTLSLIQGGWTTGSTTSEASCEAVRLACNVLVERLKPLRQSLQEQQGTVLWGNLILQAQLVSVNLSASTYWVPDQASASYLNYGAATSEVEIDLLTGATTILQSDLLYDCGQSLNPAVDLGQVEGAFVQGIGFFMNEEYLTNSDGLVVSDGTWTYKIPTVDTIPKRFNVELINSGFHKKRVLSSKASGEPPLLLAASVHCAARAAIRMARSELFLCSGCESSNSIFQLPVPATMPVVKELCGLDNVEKYLETLVCSNL